MKKILEVLRYGENDIRFHTDIDPKKDPEIINQTVVEVAMAMMTTLWGGNEQAVLAMIRALSIADLGVSVKPPPDDLLPRRRLGIAGRLPQRSPQGLRKERRQMCGLRPRRRPAQVPKLSRCGA